MRPICTALVLISLCDLHSVRAQQSAREKGERIRNVESGLRPTFRLADSPDVRFEIEARMKELGVPGLSIAVVRGGRRDWAKGYGLADVESGRRVNPRTLFLAGSVSKPVAAIRAHQLAEQGVVDLDTDVNEYLKSWKVPDNEFTKNEKVTLRRILNHTAGLTVWGFPGYDKGDKVPSVADVLDGKGNTAAVRVFQRPGKAWRYSGGGYTIMQLLITDVEQTPFPEIMARNVLKPLGMPTSTFENPLPQKSHSIAATGYRTNGKPVEGNWPIYPEMAAAGLWTTPAQLIKYATHIQRIRRSGQDGVLKVGTVAEMLTPGKNNHGLGPVISEHTFGHSGADEGFRALLVAWKATDDAVVVMVNSDNGKIMHEVVLAVADAYGLPGKSQVVRKAITLTQEDLQTYAGIYKMPQMGVVLVSATEKGLRLIMGGSVQTVVPQDRSTFFNPSNGAAVRFDFDGESVSGLTIVGPNLKATKTPTKK